jgi:hypothetical protein
MHVTDEDKALLLRVAMTNEPTISASLGRPLNDRESQRCAARIRDIALAYGLGGKVYPTWGAMSADVLHLIAASEGHVPVASGNET